MMNKIVIVVLLSLTTIEVYSQQECTISRWFAEVEDLKSKKLIKSKSSNNELFVIFRKYNNDIVFLRKDSLEYSKTNRYSYSKVKSDSLKSFLIYEKLCTGIYTGILQTYSYFQRRIIFLESDTMIFELFFRDDDLILKRNNTNVESLYKIEVYNRDLEILSKFYFDEPIYIEEKDINPQVKRILMVQGKSKRLFIKNIERNFYKTTSIQSLIELIKENIN